MPHVHRIALLILAGALAMVTCMMGASFTHAAESAEQAADAWMFWLCVALAIAAPSAMPRESTHMTGHRR